jgi:hypothetical protein
MMRTKMRRKSMAKMTERMRKMRKMEWNPMGYRTKRRKMMSIETVRMIRSNV